MRITLTDVFNKQELQNKEVTAILGEIKTSVAVLIKSVEPQAGVNAELFKRMLAVEELTGAIKPQGTDIASLKIDMDAVKKKVWQLPSLATFISLGGLIVAILAMNAK